MKIETISFRDNIHNWELSETSFNKLTLLVGASGVGKSRILQAIDILKRIALGRIYSGIEWKIKFFTSDNNMYVWSGKTDNSGEIFSFGEINEYFFRLEKDGKNGANIEFEEVYLNNEIIISRNSNQTLFKEAEMVKFSLKESIVSILKEEELIKPISENFEQIQLKDHSTMSSVNEIFFGVEVIRSDEITRMKNISLEILRNKDLNVIFKLYVASLYCKEVFQHIKDRYSEIFPLVEEICLLSKEIKLDKKSYLEIELQIKERGVPNWIRRTDISSGMLRSLIHIADIYLCVDGTVFLIDEFENSLGVNCINELTDEIISTNRNVQFIITSHHPYIINNIDFSHWKLVVRKGSIVKANPVSDLIHGESSHDKFMQLIQLSQYQTGEDSL